MGNYLCWSCRPGFLSLLNWHIKLLSLVTYRAIIISLQNYQFSSQVLVQELNQMKKRKIGKAFQHLPYKILCHVLLSTQFEAKGIEYSIVQTRERDKGISLPQEQEQDQCKSQQQARQNSRKVEVGAERGVSSCIARESRKGVRVERESCWLEDLAGVLVWFLSSQCL